jgi:decaprenyl-phosphate phosphoribosyltransferase
MADPPAHESPERVPSSQGVPSSVWRGVFSRHAVTEPVGRWERAAWRAGGLALTMRPQQWVKNVFVLAPLAFAKEVFNPELALRAGGALAVFCLLASAVYTLNDLADRAADRAHPVKRFRPIALGRVPPRWAALLLALLVATSLTGAAFLSRSFLVVALAYFAQNVAYSLKLKRVPYVDVGLLALGFVLRVVAGGLATQTALSGYLLACTALLALFLGFGKRRHELALARGVRRATLERYTRSGLDAALWLTGAATLGTYLAYSLDPATRKYFQSDELWVTTIFVILGIGRFMWLVRARPRAESPTHEMLRDGPFVAIVFGWVGVVMWILYKLGPG